MAAAHDANIVVCPIPGPSALATALSASGFAGAEVVFYGFPPAKGEKRRSAFSQMARSPHIQVFFEAPGRTSEALHLLADSCPERLACVCRELTKQYEEIRRDTCCKLLEHFAGEVRGEVTIVVGPSGDVPSTEQTSVDDAIERCLKAGLSKRDTATAVASVLQVSKSKVYERVTQMHARD